MGHVYRLGTLWVLGRESVRPRKAKMLDGARRRVKKGGGGGAYHCAHEGIRTSRAK
jgi:hypothetical protein